MCEARGLPVARIGVVDQGTRCRRGAGPVHGITGGPAQHVGGRAARVVRVSVPTHDITGEPVAATHERKQRHPLLVWAWSLVHLDFVGIAFGALFFCLSLTPSLLPRDWLFQGLIGGAQRRHRLRDRCVHSEDGAPLRVTAQALVATVEASALLVQGRDHHAVDRREPADADSSGGLAAQGVRGNGHGGPGHPRLPAHPDHRHAGHGPMRVRGARDHRPHQDDGPVLHSPLASARRGGAVHRHGDRRRAGRSR